MKPRPRGRAFLSFYMALGVEGVLRLIWCILCITYRPYGIYCIYCIYVLYAAFVAPYEGVELREYSYIVEPGIVHDTVNKPFITM
ncbi:hypothetical protein PPSQR21_011200 [Paenibacillus polymyxa SQR-21]|nr:hypothetical protein PPSQR21_011200 [Paenibacillus polymyxa SQR-21]